TTIAGGIPFLGDGGAGTNARLSFPTAVSVDPAGNITIIDEVNNRVRRLDPSGAITTIVGNGSSGFSGDGGPALSAELNFPAEFTVDGAGKMFIADDFNNRIRRVDAITGIITTVAGTGEAGFSGDGGFGVNALLAFPTAVRVDRDGNLLIGDPGNFRVRRVDARTGIITTVAGNGTSKFSGDGVLATKTGIRSSGILLDSAGNLIISDPINNRV